MGSIYHVLRGGPFRGFKGLTGGPAGANRDDLFEGYLMNKKGAHH